LACGATEGDTATCKLICDGNGWNLLGGERSDIINATSAGSAGKKVRNMIDSLGRYPAM